MTQIKPINGEEWLQPFPPCAFQKVVSEKKLTEIFIFTFLCGASKGFMKAFKPYEGL